MASEKLFHVGVKALIRNGAGQLLLEGRDRGQGVVTYDLPGGRIDVGEDIDQALRRELAEEIGYVYTGPLRHVATTVTKLSPEVKGKKVGLLIVLVDIDYDQSHQITLGEENDSYMWAEPTEAANQIAFKYDTAFCALITSL